MQGRWVNCFDLHCRQFHVGSLLPLVFPCFLLLSGGRRRLPPSRWRAPVLAAPPRPRPTRPSTAVCERCAPSPTSSSDALRRRDSHLCSRGGLPLLIVSHPDTPPASLIPTPYSYARECVLVCRRYDPCLGLRINNNNNGFKRTECYRRLQNSWFLFQVSRGKSKPRSGHTWMACTTFPMAPSTFGYL